VNIFVHRYVSLQLSFLKTSVHIIAAQQSIYRKEFQKKNWYFFYFHGNISDSLNHPILI